MCRSNFLGVQPTVGRRGVGDVLVLARAPVVSVPTAGPMQHKRCGMDKFVVNAVASGKRWPGLAEVFPVGGATSEGSPYVLCK